MTRSIATEVDVLVVGAGLSGLRAALEVHKAGLSVTVLEAMDRVGGKTLSLSASALGGVVDLGAAWINDSSQSEMYALSREFGFDLIEQHATGDDLVQQPDGSVTAVPYGSLGDIPPAFREQLDKFCESLHAYAESGNPECPHLSPHAALLDSMTFAEYAERCAPGGAGRLMADHTSRGYLGVEATEISALFMLDYMRSGTGFENLNSDLKHGGQYLRNRQGNQTFSVRLAAQLPPGSVHLSSPVSKIMQQPEGSCLVETAGQNTFEAKRVIVSVPAPLQSRIKFEPPLPASRKSLGENTVLGYYSKFIFVFDTPWWRQAGLSGIMSSDHGPIAFSRDTCSEADKQYSVTCFIVADSGRAWSKWSAAERRRLVEAQFDAVMRAAARDKGITVPAPINVIEKEWQKDPWAMGAPVPVMMPGTLTGDAGKALRESFGKIHFVGTETSVDWKGYMEGAVRSGIRGAGGQCHFSSILAPQKANRVLSYFCGMITNFSWIALGAAVIAIPSNQILALVAYYHPTYVQEKWHGFLIYEAFGVIGLVYNLWALKKLPITHEVGFVLSITMFITEMVVLLVRSSPKASTDFVSATFTNYTGWPDGVCFITGYGCLQNFAISGTLS